jgi:trehalose/maltose transport system substrate-binding protein
VSQGRGRLIKADGTVDLKHDRTLAALERARKWVGTISPPEVTSQLEDDSLPIWKRGDAAFMRNWPYAYLESMKSDSIIRTHVGVTLLPMGEGSEGRHADTLGGFQLIMSKKSENKDVAGFPSSRGRMVSER